jgi:hypothetical protein
MAAQDSDYQVQIKIYRGWETPRLLTTLDELSARDGVNSHSSGVGGSASWDQSTIKMHKAAIVAVLEERGDLPSGPAESDQEAMLRLMREIEKKGIGSNLVSFNQRSLADIA